jgi:uncharacterized iron-regulated membrane protein
MSSSTLQQWLTIHSWASLASTLVLIVLFASGLPLIFKGELESLLGYGTEASSTATGDSSTSLDELLVSAQANFPGKAVHYIVWEEDTPDLVILNIGDTPTSHFSENVNVVMNQYSGELVESAPSPLQFFIDLHTTLTMGPFGYTLMGFVALLMLVALISGVVVYAPHMRRLEFGEVRSTSSRLRWLDLHNLIGMVTLGWALVVGGTGMINSWGEYILMSWRSGQLAETVADYQTIPPPSVEEFASLNTVVAAAQLALPDGELYYIASPGAFMSTAHHYSVFMRGNTARTKFLLHPVLVDARTAEVTAAPALPAYINALLLCQPLHFGNYGGMPLKILWAVFDILTIVLLGSGVYLWLDRRRPSRKDRGINNVQSI